MSSDQFDSPGSAVGIQWADYNGALLLFDVKDYEKDRDTRFGVSDAVRVAIDVLDGPNKGDGFADTLVFPKILQAQLRGSIGKKVLGRLGQGEQKSGQTAPWKLEDPTAEDRNIARQHLAPTAPDKPPF